MNTHEEPCGSTEPLWEELKRPVAQSSATGSAHSLFGGVRVP